MRIAFLFCIAFLNVWQSGAQQIFPSRQNGLYGYIDTSGKWVINPRFLKAGLYQNGRAIAAVEDTLFLIHRAGRISVLPGLRNYRPLENDHYAIQDASGKWALADSNFNLHSGFSYSKIESMDSLFIVWNSGLSGLIDSKNRILLKEVYERIDRLSNGNIRGVNGKRTRIFKLSDSMKLVLDNIGIEYNNLFPWIYSQHLKKSKQTIIYSLEGDTLYKCEKCSLKASFQKLVFIQTGGNLAILNIVDGSVRYDIVSMSDLCISYAAPQFLFIKSTGEFYADSSGSASMLGSGIDSLSFASPNYLFFRKNNLWGLISLKGKILIQPLYRTIAINNDHWVEAYTVYDKMLYYLPKSKLVLKTDAYSEISIDSNSILVYRPGSSKLYEMNSEKEFTDSGLFRNMGRYKAGQKQIINTAGNMFQGMRNRNFSRTARWFQHRGYYGLLGLQNDTLFKAMFSSVSAINDSIDLVTTSSSVMFLKAIQGKGIVYSDELYGILNNRSGKFLIRPDYAFMDSRQFADTAWKVVRVVRRNGNFALMRKSDLSIIESTICSYISPSFNGTMRLFYKAVFYGVELQLPAGLKTFPKYLNSVMGFSEFGKPDVKNNRRENVYVCSEAVNAADYNGNLLWSSEIVLKYTYLENCVHNNFIAVNKAGQYGVLNAEEGEIIPAEYSFISRLQSDNRYFVLRSRNVKYGYVIKNGNELSEAIFTEARMFGDAYAWARIGDTMLIVDNKGNIEAPGIKQTKTGAISEGITSVKVKKGWIITDLNGKPISELNFKQVKTFVNGSVAVNYNGAWGLMDDNGNWLLKPDFTDFGAENKYAVVFGKGNHYYFFSRDGSELAKIRSKGDITALGDSYFKMVNKSGSFVFDNKGELLKKRRFNSELRAQGDTIIALSNYRMVVWNKNGKRVVSLRHYGGVKAYDKCIVKTGVNKAKNEFIDLKIMASQKYLYPDVFNDSIEYLRIYKPRAGNVVGLVNNDMAECIRYNAFVYEIKNLGNGKFFYLSDSLGNLLTEQIFRNIKYIGDGMFRVEIINQQSALMSGIINSAGVWVLEPKFKKINDFTDGIAVYSKENDFWIADTDGKLISMQPCIEYKFYNGYYYLFSEDKSGWWHPLTGWLAEFSK